MARALALLLLAVAVLLPGAEATASTPSPLDPAPIASENTEEGHIPSVGPLRGVVAAAAAIKGSSPDPRPAHTGHFDHGLVPEFATPRPTFARSWIAPVFDDASAPGHASSARQRGPPEATRLAIP